MRHDWNIEKQNLDTGLTIKRIKSGWHVLNQINSLKKIEINIYIYVYNVSF